MVEEEFPKERRADVDVDVSPVKGGYTYRWCGALVDTLSKGHVEGFGAGVHCLCGVVALPLFLLLLFVMKIRIAVVCCVFLPETKRRRRRRRAVLGEIRLEGFKA